MYYTFGKIDNRLSIDKNNRLALDLSFFIQKADYSLLSNELFYKDAQEEFFLIKDTMVTVDDINITIDTGSCFYSRRQIIQFVDHTCVFNGKLVQNQTIYDFSKYFIPALDSNDDIKSYMSNQDFFDATFKIQTDSFESQKLNSIQYIVSTPIVNIQINDDIFSNHFFVLSKQYLLKYASQFKLFCIPYKI